MFLFFILSLLIVMSPLMFITLFSISIVDLLFMIFAFPIVIIYLTTYSVISLGRNGLLNIRFLT